MRGIKVSRAHWEEEGAQSTAELRLQEKQGGSSQCVKPTQKDADNVEHRAGTVKRGERSLLIDCLLICLCARTVMYRHAEDQQ